MLEVGENQVILALKRLGVQAGDGLLVHSAVQFLGRPTGGIGMYLDALRAVIGPQGTLAVPAFNFDFASGKPFNLKETPAKGMGTFSEYVRQQSHAQRTSHPLQSLALIGASAAELAKRDTPSAFDTGSAFEGLLKLDFKLLLLGADIQAVSMIHYSEQRLAVPYRYWKDFTGRVYNGQDWETRTYRMYARDLEVNARLDLRSVQALMESRGQWAAEQLNYGWVSLFRLVNFVSAADHLLTGDPWALVGNRDEAFQRFITLRTQPTRTVAEK